MEDNPYYHKNDGNSFMQILAFVLVLAGCMVARCYYGNKHNERLQQERLERDSIRKEMIKAGDEAGLMKMDMEQEERDKQQEYYDMLRDEQYW